MANKRRAKLFIFTSNITYTQINGITMIDILKPVKLVNPQPGEEKLVFQIVNFNEATERCYIKLINQLPGINPDLAPQELVSIKELTNFE